MRAFIGVPVSATGELEHLNDMLFLFWHWMSASLVGYEIFNQIHSA